MRNRAEPRKPKACKPPCAPLTTRVQGWQDRHGGHAGLRGESRMAERRDPGALPCPAQLTPARFCLGTSGGPSSARAAAKQGVGAGALPERGGPAGRLGTPGTPGLALRGLLCTHSSLTRPRKGLKTDMRVPGEQSADAPHRVELGRDKVSARKPAH